MNILLCTSVESLLSRWLDALAVQHSVFQIKDLDGLDSLSEDVRPDLLLLHDRMLSADTVAAFKRRLPACKIFILADRPDDKRGVAFLRLGVVGYGNSYMTAERLVAAVEVVASGSVWMNQNIMQRLIVALGEGRDDTSSLEEEPDSDLATLSRRELQIARLVAKGRSNQEIAGELDIAERTVKAHLSSIFIKVGVRGRLHLALLVNRSSV